jgi:MFS family permease
LSNGAAEAEVEEERAVATSGTSEFSRKTIGVLAASIVAISLGPVALLTTFALFMQPMSRDFGWSRAQISLPLALLGVGSAVMSPIIGKAVDSWGPRRVLLIFSILFGVAVTGLAFVGAASWEVFGLFALIGLLNAGMVPYGRMIAGWFERQRGLAFGAFGFGLTILTPVLLQAMRPLIDAVGWRGAYLAFGVADLTIAVPVIYLWFREPPRAGASEHAHSLLPGSEAIEAWTSRAYWLIVGSLILSVFVYMGVVTHGVAIMTERGLSRVEATGVLSAISIGAMFAQPLIGHLVDRINSPWVVAPFAVAALVGLLMLHYLTQPIGLMAAAAILGLGASGEGGTTQYWVTRYFGLRHFSLIYGSIQPMTLVFAVAAGPVLIGAIYDRTGSYALDFKLMEIALVGAAVLIGLLGPYVYFNKGSADAEGLKEAVETFASPAAVEI